MTDDITSKIKQLIEPILEREGLTLYDMELAEGRGRSKLNVFIDRPGGVNTGHCTMVSNNLSAALEVEELFDGAYVMEVSSPGLTRKLKKVEHYSKSIGSLAQMNFKSSFNGPEKATGILEAAGENRFRVTDKNSGRVVEFGFEDVARAKLELER